VAASTIERPARRQKGSSVVVLSKMAPTGQAVFVPLMLKTRLLRLRSRVPVQRLFVKIFLWFWLTALAMFAVSVGTRMIGLHPLGQSELIAVFAPKLAAEAAQAYESGGAPAFEQFAHGLADNRERQIYLLDGFGNDVLLRAISAEGKLVAQAARTTTGPLVRVTGLAGGLPPISLLPPRGDPTCCCFT